MQPTSRRDGGNPSLRCSPPAKRVALACALAAALAACAGPPPAISVPQIVAPTAAPPPSAAATSTPPELSLVGEDQKPAPDAPALAGAPAPLERPFERIPLPEDAPALSGVEGRNERDVWLLGQAKDVTLFQWDGARVTKHKGPVCRSQPQYLSLVLSPSQVIATGLFEDGNGEARVESRWSGRGAWSCERFGDTQLLRVGDELLRMVTSGELTVSGQRLPLFALGRVGWTTPEIAARAPDDIWMYLPGHDGVAHGNGVGWELRPPGLKSVRSLRVDETGAAWLVGGDDGPDGGNIVLRWDIGARAWTRIPTPADLRGLRIRVASHRDVWILGREHVHHWDGSALRRAKTPLIISGAWISEAGELWLAGTDNARKGPKGEAIGAVFRIPVAGGKKP